MIAVRQKQKNKSDSFGVVSSESNSRVYCLINLFESNAIYYPTSTHKYPIPTK